MLKKLGITGMALAAALVVFSPMASAQDRGDYYRYRNHQRVERERRERREHEWRVRERGEYSHRGYRDARGYWHPYR